MDMTREYRDNRTSTRLVLESEDSFTSSATKSPANSAMRKRQSHESGEGS